MALLNPAALGLKRLDEKPWSVTASPIECSALALTSGSNNDPGAWDPFADSDAVGQLWGTHGPGHADYWLMIELDASEVDPPVWLPAGQVFEQTSFTGRQTLATTADAGTLVSPGRRATLLLPAYCLDPHLGPPPRRIPSRHAFLGAAARGIDTRGVWRQRIATRGGVP